MKRSNNWIFLIGSLFVMQLFFLPCGAGGDDDIPELESVLEGFEDEADGEQGELDEFISGFDESESFSDRDAEKKRVLPEGFSGHVKLSASMAFSHDSPGENEPDHRGLTKLVPELLLEYERPVYNNWKVFLSGKAFHDFAYSVKGRGDYPGTVLDEYETELEFKEVYIEGNFFGNLDLKIGRQIVVWGKSDNIRVTDVLNPMDNREPGVTDIEDLRLPAAMTRIDYYTERWNLTGLVIHEAEFNKSPVPGNDFYTAAAALPEDQPCSDFSNTQFGLSWQGFFTGWDLSFYWADVYSHDTYLSRDMSYPKLSYSRLKMYGGAVAVALGNYLLKMETAYFTGLEFHGTEDEKERLDVMAGLEYQGITDTTLTLELVNRHIFDFEDRMEREPDRAKEDRFETVFRYSGDFMHETLNITGLFILYGEFGEEGTMSRVTGEYDINDAFSIKLGVIFYESGELKRFDGIGGNDRLFAEFKYSF